MLRLSLLCISVILCVLAQTANARVDVSQFNTHGLKGWKVKSFKGKTKYTLIKKNGRKILRARCTHRTASGLYKPVRVNLHKTPILHWSWRISNVYPGLNGKTKSGDDYAARIYVADYHKFLVWESRAVNYVWANTQPRGSTWKNAFVSQDQMVAVKSGAPARPGRWVKESRNVLKDMKSYFHRDTINGVALMTDCDNGGGKATAYYRDIYFSSH